MAFNEKDIGLTVIYGIVVIFGIVGNSLVIRWFGFGEERGKPGNKLVVVLAVNDCLASICVPLLQIQNIAGRALSPPHAWYLGQGFCHLLFGVQLSLLFATPLLLIAISVERYR